MTRQFCFLDALNIISRRRVWRNDSLWTIIHMEIAGRRSYLIFCPESSWVCVFAPALIGKASFDQILFRKNEEDWIELSLQKRLGEKGEFLQAINASFPSVKRHTRSISECFVKGNEKFVNYTHYSRSTLEAIQDCISELSQV